MNKTKKLLAFLPLAIFMVGCSKKTTTKKDVTPKTVVTTEQSDDKKDIRYQIYLSAVNAGYDGDYESWLESIKGDSIELKVDNGSIQYKYKNQTSWVSLISLESLKGEQGDPGVDGKETTFKVDEGYIKWQYIGADEWKNIISLSDLTGKDGENGMNAKLQVANGFIQWQNEGDATWKDLVSLDSLKGKDGEDGQAGKSSKLQVANGYIQWQNEGDTEWKDLVSLATLKGETGAAGEAGKNSKLQVANGYIQWQNEGDTEWKDLVSLATLKGETGASGEAGKNSKLQVADGYIQWQNEGDSSWTNLISIDTLKGDNGANGKDVLMQVADGFIQWQNDGDTTWNNLISLSDLTGERIELREYEGYVQWKYESETNWTNLYKIHQDVEEFTVSFDLNGAEDYIESQTIKFGYKATKPENPERMDAEFLGWYYKGEKWSFVGYSVTEDMTLTAMWNTIPSDMDKFNYTMVDGKYDVIGFKDEYQDASFDEFFFSKNIKEMHEDIFFNCDSTTMGKIFFNGSIEDWCNIQFDSIKSNPMSIANGNFYYLDENGTIERNGFKYSLLTELVIPKSVTHIGKYQFVSSWGSAGAFSSVRISKTLESVDSYAFTQISRLTDVYYEGKLEDWCNISFVGSNANPIYESAYYDDVNLHLLNSSNEDYVLSGELVIPDGVERIGSHQFAGYKKITSVFIPSSVEYIGVNPFVQCVNISTIEIDSSNAYYDSRDYCNAIIEKSTKKLITGCKYTVIPSGVEIIGEVAFDDCSGMENLVLPEGIKEIEICGFIGCNDIKTISFPTTIEKIGKYAFMVCGSLEYVIIPDGIEVIEESTFGMCDSLKYVVIPTSVKSIGYAAISKSHGDDFNVYYKGTAEDFTNIDMDSNAFFGHQNYLNNYFYSEDEPTDAGRYWHYVSGVPTVWWD